MYYNFYCDVQQYYVHVSCLHEDVSGTKRLSVVNTEFTGEGAVEVREPVPGHLHLVEQHKKGHVQTNHHHKPHYKQNGLDNPSLVKGRPPLLITILDLALILAKLQDSRSRFNVMDKDEAEENTEYKATDSGPVIDVWEYADEE